ncbi:hypothetical protein GIB67_030782, partial [Kingdonia uniflora]
SSSVNEVSTSGRTNESDNEGEIGLEKFLGGQLVVYFISSDAFRVFCKAKMAVGGRWGNYVEFAGVKSTVERKESLLDEAAEEETELELVLAQPIPVKPSKVALKYPKKWMLKALPVSGTTGSGEVVKDKRRRVEPSVEAGEKDTEGRSATVDDLKEVEERARPAVLQGEEDTNKMVARLVKGIWLGIEEEKSKLKKVNAELEKELARSRTAALKEVRQLKASHTVEIGKLQEETKANLNEMVEERDKLVHHLMLKGYSEEEVDTIKANTYVEEEDKDKTEAVKKNDAEINKGLKELADVTERAVKLQRQVDALAMKASEAVAEHFQAVLPAKDMEFREMQRKEKVLEGEIKAKESLVKRKDELLKDLLAREELNVEIGRLRARVVKLEAMNLAELAKYIANLEEDVTYHAKVDTNIIERNNEYARLKLHLVRLKARFAIMVISDAL